MTLSGPHSIKLDLICSNWEVATMTAHAVSGPAVPRSRLWLWRERWLPVGYDDREAPESSAGCSAQAGPHAPGPGALRPVLSLTLALPATPLFLGTCFLVGAHNF